MSYKLIYSEHDILRDILDIDLLKKIILDGAIKKMEEIAKGILCSKHGDETFFKLSYSESEENRTDIIIEGCCKDYVVMVLDTIGLSTT